MFSSQFFSLLEKNLFSTGSGSGSVRWIFRQLETGCSRSVLPDPETKGLSTGICRFAGFRLVFVRGFLCSVLRAHTAPRQLLFAQHVVRRLPIVGQREFSSVQQPCAEAEPCPTRSFLEDNFYSSSTCQTAHALRTDCSTTPSTQ